MQLRGAKIKPGEQDISKGRASLARQAIPARGEATTRSKQPRLLGKDCWGSQGLNHPAYHSNMTHVVDQYGVKPQGA